MAKIKYLILMILLVVSSIPAGAKQKFRLGLCMGLYSVNDARFENVYEKGNLIYGGTVSFEVFNKIELTGGYRMFSKAGKNEFSDTEFEYSAFSLGARYMILKNGFTPYIGSGISFVSYDDNTPYYKVSERKTAFYISGGACVDVVKTLYIELNLQYHFLKVKPLSVEVDLGGLEFSLILGIRL